MWDLRTAATQTPISPVKTSRRELTTNNAVSHNKFKASKQHQQKMLTELSILVHQYHEYKMLVFVRLLFDM